MRAASAGRSRYDQANTVRIPEHRVVPQVGDEFRQLHGRPGDRMLRSYPEGKRQSGAQPGKFSEISRGVPASTGSRDTPEERDRV
jgi:hypothetical protein